MIGPGPGHVLVRWLCSTGSNLKKSVLIARVEALACGRDYILSTIPSTGARPGWNGRRWLRRYQNSMLWGRAVRLTYGERPPKSTDETRTSHDAIGHKSCRGSSVSWGPKAHTTLAAQAKDLEGGLLQGLGPGPRGSQASSGLRLIFSACKGSQCSQTRFRDKTEHERSR